MANANDLNILRHAPAARVQNPHRADCYGIGCTEYPVKIHAAVKQACAGFRAALHREIAGRHERFVHRNPGFSQALQKALPACKARSFVPCCHAEIGDPAAARTNQLLCQRMRRAVIVMIDARGVRQILPLGHDRHLALPNGSAVRRGEHGRHQ